MLGAGRMGAVHAKLLRGLSHVDSVVLGDTDDSRSSAVARSLGVDSAPTPMEALVTADAVVIATPPATHDGLIEAAIERGRPVLCEKPLADDLEAAIAVARRVDAAGVPVQLGFQRRFDPGYAEVHRRISTGELGTLYLIRLSGTEPVRPRSEKTNLLRNTAIHDFDVLRWLSQAEVTSIHVRGSTRSLRAADPGEDPDSIVASVALANGCIAVVSASRLSPLGYDARAEVLGSLGHVTVGSTSRTPIVAVEGRRHTDPDRRWHDWEDRFELAFRRELQAFVEVARGKASPAVTVHDGVEAQRIADAGRRSLDVGRAIEMER